MHKLPLIFYSKADANNDFEKPWLIQSGALQAECAIPTEFGGNGGGFSPEDLYLQALINCFIGTFKVYAKASRINFSNLSVTGELTVDQNQTRQVSMKKVILNIQIQGTDRPERIETIVAKTLRDGFILNSVKTEIEHKLEIS
jgi:organic hydroperoxide reductase OsmC/OhrA